MKTLIAWISILILVGFKGDTALAQADYSPIDLGTLGGARSSANDVNELGQVVGSSTNQNDKVCPFLWSGGSMRNLGGLGGNGSADGFIGTAHRINRFGSVVGWAALAEYPLYRGFRYRDSQMKPLGTVFPWPYSRATAINSGGAIVGALDGTSQANPRAPGFLWTNGSFQTLPMLDGSTSAVPTGINETGTIVGISYHPTKTVGFYVKNNSLQEAASVAGTTSAVITSLNDQDDFVGNCTDNGTGQVRAVLWKNQIPSLLPTMPGQTDVYPQDINNAGVIVGNASNRLSDRACIYKDGTWLDLNDLLPANSGWVLRSARAISDNGFIVGQGEHNGQTRAFLLVPSGEGLQIDGNELRFKATDDGSIPREVVGIVCDNLSGMEVTLKNRLDLYLTGYPDAKDFTWTLTAESSNTNNTGYITIDGANHLQYFPPDEYNDHQTPQDVHNDITKPASRNVSLELSFTSNGVRYKLTKPICLARPPVILIHGINNSPDVWDPFVSAISGMFIRHQGYAAGVTPPLAEIPFVTVNHNDPLTFTDPIIHTFGVLDNGNAPVELGALLLSERIRKTIYSIRNGLSITDRDENLYIKSFNFNGFLSKKLSIKRVDVIGWSYGGVIARWYLKNQAPEGSASWYKYNFRYKRSFNGSEEIFDNSHLPDMQYQNDIRKLITLGSMWRGVPFANYVNEAIFGSEDFGQAPTIFGVTLFDHIVGISLASPLNCQAPSIQVMAVESKWMRYLIYGNNNEPGISRQNAITFQSNVSYGSVAGNDQRYLGWNPLISWEKKINPYRALDFIQQKSWFPYLRLEHRSDNSTDAYSDGMVPVWSSAIPGSYILATAPHNGYETDQETINYVVKALNDANLPDGNSLNFIWNNPAPSDSKDLIQTKDRSKTWKFAAGFMAPYPQSDLYNQVQGAGRVVTGASSSNSRVPFPKVVTNSFLPAIKLLKDGNDIIAEIKISNPETGGVILPDIKITSVSITFIPGNNTLYDLHPTPLGTLRPGASKIAYFRFPNINASLGATFALRLNYTYAGIGDSGAIATRVKLQ